MFSSLRSTQPVSLFEGHASFRIHLPPTLTSTSSLRKDLIAVKAVQAMMNGDEELHNEQLRQPETASTQFKSIPTEIPTPKEIRRNK